MPEMGTDTFGRILMRGDIEMGANTISFTDVVLLRGAAGQLDVMNLAEDAYEDILAEYLLFNLVLASNVATAYFKPLDADNAAILLQARDTGVGGVEIGRLQGADVAHLLLTRGKFGVTVHAADVAHRGLMYRVEGGAGVPDKLYCVMKNTLDAYEATQVAVGS